MKINDIFAGIAGLVSGCLSFYFSFQHFFQSFGNDVVFIFPGLFFGMALCFYFTLIYKKGDMARFIGLTLVSFIAYNLAYWATFFSALVTGGAGMNSSQESSFGLIPAFLVGGFVGGFLVSAGVRWTLVRLSFKEVFLLGAIGALLGTSGVLPIYSYQYLPLFLIWQAGMMVIITRLAGRHFAEENLNTSNL